MRPGQPVDSVRPLIHYKDEVGTRIERVHRTYNMCRMLPLSSPGEAGSPGVEDLVERPVEGEGEGALKEGSAARPRYQDSGKL